MTDRVLVTGVGNVGAAVVVQSHPHDCPVCGGVREVRVAPMRWLRDGLRPAWPNALKRECPWPFGGDALLDALGVAQAGPEGGDAA